MALPLTLVNIQNHVSIVTYEQLAKVCDDPLLTQLSSEEGISRTYQGALANVRMGWYRDETDTINGLFIRVHTQNMIVASVLKEDGNLDELIITQQFTNLSEDVLLHVTKARQQFEVLQSAKHDEEIVFHLDALKEIPTIQAFFAKSREMLPEPYRTDLLPLPQKPLENPLQPRDPHGPKPASNDYNYLYIGGALLAILGIAYLAKRVVAKPQPAQG
jgi:hypothetical protein